MKRYDGRNGTRFPAVAFAEAGGSQYQAHTLLGTALVRVFLRTEEGRPSGITVDLLVCHMIFA